jgi:hypothetical protein
MSERFGGSLESVLTEALEPVRAPESLWYRVNADIAARRPAPRRSMSRLALAFGVMLVAVVSVGWILDRPNPQVSPAARPMQISRGEHSCVLCHV